LNSLSGELVFGRARLPPSQSLRLGGSLALPKKAAPPEVFYSAPQGERARTGPVVFPDGGNPLYARGAP